MTRPTTRSTRALLFMVLFPLTILFFTGGPDWGTASRSLKEIWNIGHIIYFSLLPLLFTTLRGYRDLPPRSRVILVFAAAAVIGAGVELLQNGLDRSPDIGDIFRNMIGALVSVLFFLPARFTIPKRILSSCRITTLFLILHQLIPTSIALLDEYTARSSFPILADFQTPYELSRWGGKAEKHIIVAPGSQSNMIMQARLTTDTYSGVTLNYFPRDWRGMNELRFRLFNTQPVPLEIHCRVHDLIHARSKDKQYSDRFNTVFSLDPGWNELTLSLEAIEHGPNSRRMDLSRIHAVGFFVVSQSEPMLLYLDDLHLR